MANKNNWIWLIGIGYLFLTQKKSKGTCHHRKAEEITYVEYKDPYEALTFTYNKSWKPSQYYNRRYEGSNGFFEVAEISTMSKNIDEITQHEIHIEAKAYGSQPQVQILEVDHQPARLIFPSNDQVKVCGREVALIIKNKKVIVEQGRIYQYTIIWSDLQAIDGIISTIKFIG